MGNIFNHNRPVYKLKTSKSDYWDMHLSQNNLDSELHSGIQDDCISAYIDTNISECIEDEYIDSNTRKNLVSLGKYVWENSVNNGLELNNIGYTGIDNGLILFDKDNITEQELNQIKKNSILALEAEDYRLRLTPVAGNNKIYSYDTEIISENDTQVIKLDGGFYQGFFKTNNGCNYQVLPDKLGEGWTMEFMLKPEDYEKDSDIKTLNDTYPENKGIFFYVGTRAENKWYKIYKENGNEHPEPIEKDKYVYYGTLTYNGLSSNNPLTTEQIFSLSRTKLNEKTIDVNIPVNARRVIIAFPKLYCELKSVTDVNSMSLNILNSFINSPLTREEHIYVEETKETLLYKIYVIDYAIYNDTENTYKLNFKIFGNEQ